MVEKEVLVKLKHFKSELSKEIPVVKMLLFGSQVSGKPHRYSDYDLIIISKKFKGVQSRYRSLGFYKHWPLEAPFDFLCFTPQEFNRLSKQKTIVAAACENSVEI